MLFTGITSTDLNPISINSSILSVINLLAAALYTAGCAVSLKEGEKKILTKLTLQFTFKFHPLPPC
jgi:hypothetical protein